MLFFRPVPAASPLVLRLVRLGPACLAIWFIALSFGFATPAVTLAQSLTPEEQLAQKYAPRVVIKKQSANCDSGGEQYLPVTVDAVLGSPDVVVRRIAEDGEDGDPVVLTAPTAQQLAGLDENHYLDLPGDPRQPGCEYEQWFERRVAELGLQPTVYARVATQEDRPGMLALQYWHFWVFDDFNNKHESDWEMVQLNFEAATAEEALTKEPFEVAFAQHGGGERADWDAPKLQRDGNTISIFPAAGSHASYYQDTLWIGWGAGGAGFGCDDIRRPTVELQPNVVLIPETIDPNGEFAWLLYEGRWGQREQWEYNGPKGINLGRKWTEPVGWTEGIRETSVPLPSHSTLGPGPAGIFCSVTGWAGSIVTFFPIAPWLAAVFVIAVFGVIATVAALGWRYFARAAVIYVQHLPAFLGISVFFYVVARIGVRIDDWIAAQASSGGYSSTVGVQGLLTANLGIGISSVEQILSYALVTPAVVYATMSIVRGERSTRGSLIRAVRGFPKAVATVLIPLLISGLLVGTVILAPLGLYKGVQWLFAVQAHVIDGAGIREARHASKRAVKTHWWRTLGIAAAMGVFSGLPGPLIGIIGLVTGLFSMDVAGGIASALYLVAYPITVIGATLYYLTLTRGKEGAAELQRNAPIAEGTSPVVAPA